MRTHGSKNTQSNPTGQCVRGAATSAAKMNGKHGIGINSQIAWYENGRAIRWGEIQRSVATAYNKWRIKMAERGTKVMDGFEVAQAHIKEALNNRGPHAHA